jgi:hypothetical protein
LGSSIYLSQSQSYRADERSKVSRQNNDGWFSIGNFVVPQLSAGLSYHLRQTRLGLKNYQEHNFGLGFLWTPTPYLGIGASFQNFRPPPEDLPEELAIGSDSGVGLLYLHSDHLRLRMDYSRKIHRLASLSSSEWAFGLENSMTPWALARIGIAQETSDTRVITQKLAFGLGFAGPRFGIHYAFQQFKISNKGSEHSVDLTIPF